MTIDDFLVTIKKRAPTSQELIALCDHLGVRVVEEAGRPTLKVTAQNKAEGLLLAKLLQREPWRTQVLLAKGIDGARAGVGQGDTEALLTNGTVIVLPYGEVPDPYVHMYYRAIGALGWIVTPRGESVRPVSRHVPRRR